MARRPALERPVMIAAFRGWNDGGQGASLAAGYLAKAWDARAVRRDRPGGVLRLPGDAAPGAARGRDDAPDRLAGERLLPRRAPTGWTATRCSCSASSRTCAGARSPGLIVDFARELGVELFVTLGALLADVPHTRRAPVTGSATDPSWSSSSASRRRATRGRPGSSASSTTRAAGRTSGRRACGRRCRTTSRSRRARRRRLRSASGWRRCSAAEIDTAELDEAADAYVRQVSEAIASTRRRPRTSRSSSGAPTSWTRATCRRASRSPPSCSRFLREREESEEHGTGPSSEH